MEKSKFWKPGVLITWNHPYNEQGDSVVATGTIVEILELKEYLSTQKFGRSLLIIRTGDGKYWPVGSDFVIKQNDYDYDSTWVEARGIGR